MNDVDKSIRNSLIAESISDWIWEFDFVENNIKTTDAWKGFLGYEKDECEENADFWLKLFHPEDIDKILMEINNLLESKGDTFNAEFRIKTKKGNYKWIFARATAKRDVDGKVTYMAGFALNVTPYKTVKESEEKYRTLFNNVDDIILLSTMNEDGTPGKYIEVNDVATKVLGYSKEELMSMSSEHLHPLRRHSQRYRELQQEYLERVQKQEIEQEYSFQTEVARKDNTLLPVEAKSRIFSFDGKPVKLSVIRDISKRLEMEKALRESIERNMKIVQLSPHGVFMFDGSEIIFVNEAAVKMLKANSKEELMGRDIRDFLHNNSISTIAERYNSLKAGKELETTEIELLRLDGSRLVAETVSTPLYIEGHLVVLSYIVDVTEQKRILEENKKLLDQTIEFDRLKTEFFLNISHELRTPLNIILSSIQLLNLVHGKANNHLCKYFPSFEKYMGVMQQNSYRLLKLINNLIDLTRLDSGFLNLDLQNYNIIEVVEDITLSVSSYIESKGISLVFDTDVEEKITACDGDKIERVILNLLSNAVKFTKPGGTIEVKMKDMGDSVQIIVKDTGCGIPEDKLNVIFERFRQVDSILTRKAEGSGIGLSLVKALVEAHGGSIEVKSEIDKGTEFFINIPVKVQKATEILDKIRLKDDGEERKFQRINIEFSDIYS